MNFFSLELNIAEISIIFYCKNKKDSNFLREEYSDFIQDNGIPPSFKYKIFLVKNRSKKIKIKKGKFYLPVYSLKKEFRLFNDLFKEIINHIFIKNEGLLLHASSLIDGDNGYIFIGEEGSGKTTVRKLLHGLTSLGDDTAVIRKIKGKYFLFGSPFYQKTNTVYPNKKRFKLFIFNLRQADFDLIESLDFSHGIKNLMDNTYFDNLSMGKKSKELLFSNVCDFCSKNKVFNLFFRKEKSFFYLLNKVDELKLDEENIKIMVQRFINPRVLEKIPKDTKWVPALGLKSFLGGCSIINEISWHFEFGSVRKVEQISRKVASQNLIAPHIDLIKKVQSKLIKKSNDDKKWIILVRKRSDFTIIDGNHYAIANYLGTNKKDCDVFKFLIGYLPLGIKIAFI